MRKLFAFLIQYSVVMLFILLQIIAFSFIIRYNEYQKSVFFSSSNTVLASAYEKANALVEFWFLKSNNRSLAEENNRLKNQLVEAKNRLAALPLTATNNQTVHIGPEKEIHYILAKVINNSTNKTHNFITLNKGLRDGIKPHMGVINEDGVVGFVSHVSDKFAVVIPILNARFNLIAKLPKQNTTGPVHWDGLSYRYAKLTDIARHVHLSLGDTVVTSGFTRSFPEGVMIGTVEDFHLGDADTYFDVKLKLSVNFRSLSYVNVIQFINNEEQSLLEKEAKGL